MQSFGRSENYLQYPERDRENSVCMELHLLETKNFVLLQKQIRISAQICHSIVTELSVAQ